MKMLADYMLQNVLFAFLQHAGNTSWNGLQCSAKQELINAGFYRAALWLSVNLKPIKDTQLPSSLTLLFTLPAPIFPTALSIHLSLSVSSA